MNLRITYDRSVNAAYIYLAGDMDPVAYTYPCDPAEVRGQINLDFDADGRLIGVEVLDASRKLPKALLDAAEVIG
jgi:uncharacterized protein YuzE